MTGAASSEVFATALRVNMTPQTVDIRTSSTTNAYGERTFTGTATTHDCYIERVVEQPAGINADVLVDYKVFIPNQTIAVDTSDEITLPAPISAVRPIVGVETRADPLGQVGQVVYVGRVNQ